MSARWVCEATHGGETVDDEQVAGAALEVHRASCPYPWGHYVEPAADLGLDAEAEALLEEQEAAARARAEAEGS